MKKIFNKNNLKKILLVLIIICSLSLIKVTSKIIVNKRFIANYPEKDQEHRLVLMSVLNFYQPYIVHYNYGNYYYQKEMYEDAYNKYSKALSYKIPKSRLCDVKINISLTLIKQAELIKEDNKAEALEMLGEAKMHLKDCIELDLSEENDDEEEKENNQKGQDDNQGKKEGQNQGQNSGQNEGQNQGQNSSQEGGQQGGKEKTSEQKKASNISENVDEEISNVQSQNSNNNGKSSSNKNGEQNQGQNGSSGEGSSNTDQSKLDELKDRAEQANSSRENSMQTGLTSKGNSSSGSPEKSDIIGCIDCL